MGRGPDYPGVKPASATSIEISFYYDGAKHRERIKLKPTPLNLARAHEHRIAILKSIEDGIFEYHVTFPDSKQAEKYRPKILSLKEYLEGWLDTIKPFIKVSTHNGYDKILRNQVIPQFSDATIVSGQLLGLSRKDIRDWAKSREISPKTLGNIISPLRAALDDAVDDEILEVNPLANMKIRRRRGAARRPDPIDPFDGLERQAILAQLEPQNRNLVQLLFWTGLRTSELVALDWSDVDWIHGKLHINKALTQHSEEPEEPKTEAGNRFVDLLGPALKALQDQKQFTFLAGKEIFQNPRTKMRWTGDQPLRKTMWQPALKRSGVRYRYLYQCRHTYATMMLDAGEHIRWISAQLGHTDWTFTARTYTRFMPQEFEGAGGKAEEKFGRHGQHFGRHS